MTDSETKDKCKMRHALLGFFMGAGSDGKSACQFSKACICLSRLPSTQKCGSSKLRDKAGLHSNIYDNEIFLFRTGILLPK